jgi:hypothetical protein
MTHLRERIRYAGLSRRHRTQDRGDVVNDAHEIDGRPDDGSREWCRFAIDGDRPCHCHVAIPRIKPQASGKQPHPVDAPKYLPDRSHAFASNNQGNPVTGQ